MKNIESVSKVLEKKESLAFPNTPLTLSNFPFQTLVLLPWISKPWMCPLHETAS